MSRKARPPVAVTASMVRDQAHQLQRLSLTPTRAKELARDAALHIGALDAASDKLELDDEPARFLALLCLFGGRGQQR